jgi:hypothetical protein
MIMPKLTPEKCGYQFDLKIYVPSLKIKCNFQKSKKTLRSLVAVKFLIEKTEAEKFNPL